MADFDPKAYLAAFGDTPGGGSGAQPAAAPAASKPGAPDPGEDPWEHSFGAMTAAGVNKFADTATFGLSTDLQGVLAAAIGKAMGKKMTVADGINAARESLAGQSSDHPYASMVGTGIGMVAGGAGLVKGAEMVGAKGLTTFAKGEGLAGTLTNAAKGATLGAAGGAIDAGGHGDDPIGGAEAGAVGGAVLGPAAAAVTRLARPLIYKASGAAEGVTDRINNAAWKIVGGKLGMTADELQTISNNVMAQRGSPMSLAEAVDWNKQGILRQMAAKDGGISGTFNDLAETTGGQMQSDLQHGLDQAAGGITDVANLSGARAAKMDAAMAKYGDRPVTVTKAHADLLSDNAVQRQVSEDVSGRLSQALAEVESNGSSQALTIKDMDTLRQAARKVSRQQFGSGNNSIGLDYAERGDALRGVARSADPGYSAALDEYAADSQHLNGFKSGLSGADASNLADDSLRRDVLSPKGQEGYKAGTLARLHGMAGEDAAGAARAANDLSNNVATQKVLAAHPELQQLGQEWIKRAQTVNSINGRFTPSDHDANELAYAGAHAVGAAGSHNPAGMLYQIGRVGQAATAALKASPQVLARAAQLLTDPTQTQAGINVLRRAGASEKQIRDILHTAGSAFGGAAFSGLGQ